MKKKSQPGVLIAMLALGTLLQLATSVKVPAETDTKQTYIQGLEKTLLHNFFPPKDGWDLSDGSAQAILECDGQIKNIVVTKHLFNRFNKRSNKSFANPAIIGALKQSSPVETPPKTIQCPATLIVNFNCADQTHGEYICKVILK